MNRINYLALFAFVTICLVNQVSPIHNLFYPTKRNQIHFRVSVDHFRSAKGKQRLIIGGMRIDLDSVSTYST